MSAATEFSSVETAVHGKVGVLTLNRPDSANTFDAAMAAQVVPAVDELLAQRCRVLIVTGAGKHFCAGADLKAVAKGTGPRLGDTSYIDVFAMTRVPVIAAINGKAMGGGCELALACDLRVIAASASIGLPEARFGGIPAAGGTQRLPRLVGPAMAKRLLWLGMPLGAEQARTVGLVEEVVPDANLMQHCLDLAGSLAQRPAYALEAIKFLVAKSADVDLRSGIEMETYVARKMATAEQRRKAQEEVAAADTTYRRLFDAR
jgi:enoyl-CoA hydratase/carnithine racemase